MEKDLGEVVSSHRGKLTKLSGVIAGLLLFVGCAYATKTFDPPNPDLCLLMTIGFGVLTLVMAYVTYRDYTLVITVFERGIGWDHGGDDRGTQLAFADIANVTETRINGRPAALVFHLHSGKEMRVFSNVQGHGTLVKHLKARPASPSLPQAIVR